MGGGGEGEGIEGGDKGRWELGDQTGEGIGLEEEDAVRRVERSGRNAGYF